jgi:hypothetical protein
MNLKVIAFLTWIFAIGIWQLIFNSHPIVSEILWEIHTIFTSVILLYILLNLITGEKTLNFIKIVFRIVFKVWLIIFIAFSMQKSFNQKGFVLTITFIFGYLEGLIDLNFWLKETNSKPILSVLKSTNTKKDKMIISIALLSAIHILCAFISLIFFSIG